MDTDQMDGWMDGFPQGFEAAGMVVFLFFIAAAGRVKPIIPAFFKILCDGCETNRRFAGSEIRMLGGSTNEIENHQPPPIHAGRPARDAGRRMG
jgi:hypothetical protein